MQNLASQVPSQPAKKPLGLVKDPAGDFSSKRFESMMAFGIAVLVIAADIVLGSLRVNLSGVPVVQLVIALLTYSAAMQGVSVFSERNLFPGGANTMVGNAQSPLSRAISGTVQKLLGPTATSSSSYTVSSAASSSPSTTSSPSATGAGK